jgi:hypothetical protein
MALQPMYKIDCNKKVFSTELLTNREENQFWYQTETSIISGSGFLDISSAEFRLDLAKSN